MASFVSQHASDPYARFTTGVVSELTVRESGSPNDANALTKAVKELVGSFALTNKLLASTYGSGITDRRTGQAYYIDVGVVLPDITAIVGTPSAGDVRILVNTSKISELVSPSLGEVDLKFNVGVDSFSIHRYRVPDPPLKTFPITVVCDKLQENSNSRYLAILSGENGTALSATAQTVLFGEMPSSLEFRVGYMDPIPLDTNGTLNRTVYPMVFNNLWKDSVEGMKAPRIPNTDELLWNSSQIYAMTIRLFVIPTITPRVHVMSS